MLDPVSGDQGADQRAEESLASFTRVMDELKEPEIEGEFLLRNAAMRPQPGAQQGPKTLYVDSHWSVAHIDQWRGRW